MHQTLRLLMWITATLLVPIVPFVVAGAVFETEIEAWLNRPFPAGQFAAAVVGILATDILLPVPSSLVTTLAGARLGVIAGTLASAAGMTLGAIVGFALARRWGRSLSLRLVKESDLQAVAQVSDRYGVVVLVVARALPVVAEASVLLVGIQRMSWSRFLPAVVLSNLGVSLAYAGFGTISQHQKWLPLALGISVALPLMLATAVRGWLTRSANHIKNPLRESNKS